MVYRCDVCLRNFDSSRGLNIHRSHCKSKNNVNVRSYQIDIPGDNDNVIIRILKPVKYCKHERNENSR